MRLTLAALVLALAVLAPTAAAQAPSFSEAYQVRAAVGDLPTTAAREADGSWNVEQRLRVAFDNASTEDERTFHFTLPAGAALVNATCDCSRSRHTVTASSLAFTIEALTQSGERTITILTRAAADEVLGGGLVAPLEAPADRVVILYAPGTSEIASNAAFTEVGPSPSDRTKTIHYAQFSSGNTMPGDFWFAVHPADAVAPPPAKAFNDDLVWLFLALGIVAGASVWSVLVSRGLVQAKSRKQVAAAAAHVEAAKEPPAVLEGKKRALLAALTELELAKQANEMPLEVYDVVKADLKKQAVTVMRALETSGDQAKA